MSDRYSKVDDLTPEKRQRIWQKAKYYLSSSPINMTKMCRSDFPGTDYGEEDEYKIDKWKICENDATIRHPIPDPSKTTQIVFEVDGKKRKFEKFKDKKTTGAWLTIILEIIIIILADFSVATVVLSIFYFNPILNLIIDIIATLFLLVMHGPLALIGGAFEIIPDFLGASPITLIEIFPWHLAFVIIRLVILRGKSSSEQEGLIEIAKEEQVSYKSVECVIYGEDIFDNFDRDEYMTGKKSKRTEELEKFYGEEVYSEPPLEQLYVSKNKNIL